jgi:hypothetical protein
MKLRENHGFKGQRCEISTICKITNIYFSWIDWPTCSLDNCSLVKAKGRPYCMTTAPIPLLDASHSRTKVLVKSCIDSTRVGHISSFKALKDWSTTKVQLKALFLRRVVRGATIFP